MIIQTELFVLNEEIDENDEIEYGMVVIVDILQTDDLDEIEQIDDVP